MGVRGLQTFIQRSVENGVEMINIFDEVKKWKRINKKDSVWIIIDFMGIIQILYEKAFLFGGRHQIIAEMYYQFLVALKEMNVQLAFFMDGAVQVDKRTTWLDRQNEKYELSIKMFDNINAGQSIEKIINDDIPHITNCVPLIENISKKHAAHFHVCQANECDAELAQFARQHCTLAIITNDTDFLIFEGDWQFWSSNTFNVHRMTIQRFNRSALRARLGLSQIQMPLFATLSGNDYIADELKQFHESLGGPFWKKFDNVANWIRNNQWRNSIKAENLTDDDILNIANSITGNNCQNLDIEEAIKISISSYRLNVNVPTETDPLKKIVAGKGIYEILAHRQYSITLEYFDMREPGFMSYTDFILPFVRRQYGVILRHENDPNITVKTYLKQSHNESIKTVQIVPDYPDFELPPLLELIDDKTNKFENEKWKLALWMVSVHGIQIPDAINTIRQGFNVAILTIYILVKTKQITLLEADSILLTIVSTRNGSIPRILEMPSNVTTRKIMICHLYCKTHNSIRRCFSLFKIDGKKDYISFDGVYFCHIIDDIENGFKKEIEDISDLRIYVN